MGLVAAYLAGLLTAATWAAFLTRPRAPKLTRREEILAGPWLRVRAGLGPGRVPMQRDPRS